MFGCGSCIAVTSSSLIGAKLLADSTLKQVSYICQSFYDFGLNLLWSFEMVL